MSNCNPTYQEVKKKVKISCPSTSTSGTSSGASLFNQIDLEYIDTVYNEVSHTVTNGTIREKWDNSSDPRYQQYDVDSGQPLFENYCRADRGEDERYFQHLWEYPASHTSTKEIWIKYEPVYETATGAPTTDRSLATAASLAANSGSCLRKQIVTNNFTLDKVDISVSGLPETEESYVFWAGTDDLGLIFTYLNDTRTVVKPGDVINGHTVVSVANFCDTKADRKIVHTVIGDRTLKLNNTINVNVGDSVFGYGNTLIPEGTTILSVDYTANTVVLNLPSTSDGLTSNHIKRVKNIIISDADPNKIPNTNYCYARLGAASNLNDRNVKFKVTGPGFNKTKYETTTSNGSWTGSKIDLEGGNQIFNSGAVVSKTVKFDGGSLVINVDPILDGNEYDTQWWISSITGTLPAVGTSFQTTIKGGKDKVKIKFKIVSESDIISASGGDFAPDATYTASLSGAEIVARAGYGIIRRAAMVGIFISKRKDVSYTPIFSRKTNVIDEFVDELTNNFPELDILKDISQSQYYPDKVTTQCDPFLTPDVEIPRNNASPSVSIDTDFTELQSEIDDKVDEIAANASISEITNLIKDIKLSSFSDPGNLENISDNLSSNLRDISLTDTSKVDRNSKIDISLKQDTAVTQLIQNTLSKFNEIPSIMEEIMPPQVPREMEVVDGENESTVPLVKNAFRDLPVTQDLIQFIVDDLSLNDDKSYQGYGTEALRDTIQISVFPRWLYGAVSVGSETAGESEIKIPGTALGGTSPENDLFIYVKDVNNNTGAITSTGFKVYSGSTPKMSYPNISGTVTTTPRTTFNVTGVSGGTYSAVVNTAGGTYTAGQQIVISGASLGGVSPTNDATIFIDSVTGTGSIQNITVSGLAATSATTNNVGQTVIDAEFTVGINWSGTETISDDVYTVSITDESAAGRGYMVGDTILITGSNLGGTNGVHDLTINVSAIDSIGGIADITFSGTPETLYTGVSGTTLGNASGSGATFNVLKGQNSSGTASYIVALNSGGTLYNTSIAPSATTVDTLDKNQGTFRVNGASLGGFPSQFKVQFNSVAPKPLVVGTQYSAAKINDTDFFVYNTPPTSSYNSTSSISRFSFLLGRIYLAEDIDGMTDVVFSTNGVTQNVTYYPGTSYVDTISVTALGETYPSFSWKGANFEYQASHVKEYEFDLVHTSENISSSNFNKGNPLQIVPTITQLTQDLNPSDTTIYVRDTSKFLSSGYLMIPKWVRKTEIYLDMGSGDNRTQNTREHYYYDGEEIIYYSSKTATSFNECKRSQFETDYLMLSDLSPFPNDGGMLNSYQSGYSVQQYWEYRD